MVFNEVMEATTHPAEEAPTMFESTADITEGTVTEFGTVQQVSMTAALIGGRWVPFTKLVTHRRAVALAIPQGIVDAVTPEASAIMRAQSDANITNMVRS